MRMSRPVFGWFFAIASIATAFASACEPRRPPASSQDAVEPLQGPDAGEADGGGGGLVREPGDIQL